MSPRVGQLRSWSSGRCGEAGLDPNTDVTWLAIGSPATAMAAFTTGQVDVAMSYSQLEVNLRAAGAGFDKLLVLAGSDTLLGVFWQAIAVANCDWADSHPDTVMKFCRALNQGFASLVDDPEAGRRPSPTSRSGRTSTSRPHCGRPTRIRSSTSHHSPSRTGATRAGSLRTMKPDLPPVVQGCATADRAPREAGS